jgi:TFIIF-interacting CTD phosphatase-like protein
MYIYKRPYLDHFLNSIAELGEVSIFTASVKQYADPIIDEIDPKGIIKRRFYREHCKIDKDGNILKNME